MGTFFDDASLVMIPSGVKESKLYSIKPVPEYGSEEITNGDFSSGTTNWTASNATLSIESGALKITSTGGNRPQAYQTLTGLTIGKNYIITAVAKRGTTASAVEIEISGIGNPTNSNKNFTTQYATIDAEFTATSTSHIIQAKIDESSEPVGTTAFFQSVSMKEVLVADGDFTFTRGTDTATRVNSAGNIEKETQNLLLQSNTFNTSWNSYNLSRTAGANDFDGGTNAWTIAKLGSYGLINQSVSNTGVHTFSVYAKAGTLNFIALTTSASPFSTAYFDLQNGVVGSLVNAIDSNIESVGGGWYRCSLTSNVTASGFWRIYPADSDGGLSNANLGNVIIYKAQLEQSLVSRTYIETTAAAVYAGITDNLPRLDYSGGASCPSLLLEPQRTNLFTQSEYFSAWSTIQNATITDNNLSSPEGVQNAAKITDNATSGNHRVFESVTTTAASHTFSLFLKKGTISTAFLRFNSSGDVAGANVDLDAGTITATAGSATIEDYGNDWYRCSITGTAVAGTSYLYVYMKQLSAYSGSGQDMYLFGAQIETGSYATSYIPTYGTSATRAKDFINQNIQTLTSGLTEGTLFVEFEKPNTGENNDLMRLRGSGALGRAYIYNYGVGFAADWGTSQNFTIGENTKAAWRLDSLSSGVEFVNGVKGSGASGTAWSDIRLLRFNADGNGGVLKIKKILFFPTALTDAECITLTTL